MLETTSIKARDINVAKNNEGSKTFTYTLKFVNKMALTPGQIAKIAADEAKKIQTELAKKDSQNKGNPVIKIGLDFEAKKLQNREFKKWLLDNVHTKTGVITPIPVQFATSISLYPGNWGHIQDCNYEGTLVSDNLKISRTNSTGSAYWSNQPAQTNSTTSSVSAYDRNVAMQRLTAKIPIDDYRLFTEGYDVMDYCQKEINKQINFELDKQIFIGSGSPFIGVTQDPSINKIAVSTGSLTAGSLNGVSALRQAFALIDPGYRTPDLKLYYDKTWESAVMGAADTNNRLIDLATNIMTVFGHEAVPMSAGVLRAQGANLPVGSLDMFVWANLKEAYTYANKGLAVEAIRTTVGNTDYYFYDYYAMGVRQPAAVASLSAKP